MRRPDNCSGLPGTRGLPRICNSNIPWHMPWAHTCAMRLALLRFCPFVLLLAGGCQRWRLRLLCAPCGTQYPLSLRSTHALSCTKKQAVPK
jgi:hypothetical protein